jgi:hypothetical protein
MSKRADEVILYFRPSSDAGDKSLARRKRSRRIKAHIGVVGHYLRVRSKLNRDAHFLSGMLSVISIIDRTQREPLANEGLVLLRDAYQALAIEPDPEAGDVERMRDISTAICRYASDTEKMLKRSVAATQMRDSSLSRTIRRNT